MEIPMLTFLRIVTAALVLAALSLAAAMPLVAAWRIWAEQPTTSMQAREPVQQSTDLPSQRPGPSLVY
jgi:hypothetical protein